MKKILIVIATLFASTLYSQQIDWVKTYGGNGYDALFSSTTLHGNLVVGGWFDDTLDLGGSNTFISTGSVDGYIAIIDTLGNVLRSMSIGGPDLERITFLGQSGNSIIFFGESTSNYYEIFGQQYSGIPEFQHMFIGKVNANLDSLEWIHNDFNIGTPNYATSLSIYDTTIVVSTYLPRLTSLYHVNGTLLWNKLHSTSSSVLSVVGVDGIYTLTDSFHVKIVNGMPTGGYYKFILQQYDVHGHLLNTKNVATFDPPELYPDFYPTELHLDRYGNVLIAGRFNNQQTINGTVYNLGPVDKSFLIKYDNTLDYQWMRILGTNLESNVISLTSDDSTYYVGWIESDTMSYSPYFHVSEYDILGNPKAGFDLTSTNDVLGTALEILNDDLYIGGYYKGAVNFETLPIINDDFDIFVLKLKPEITNAQPEPSMIYEGVKVFPNPSTNHITIQCPDHIGNLRVFNMLGQQIVMYEHIQSNDFSMDTSAWPSGVFHIIVGNKTHMTGIKSQN